MAGISITIHAGQTPTMTIDESVIRAWLTEVLNDGRNTFIQHISKPGPSAAGDYPSTVTGQLAGSVDFEVGDREGTLFTDVEYAGYLAFGTSKMAPRRMLEDVMDEVIARADVSTLGELVKIE